MFLFNSAAVSLGMLLAGLTEAAPTPATIPTLNPVKISPISPILRNPNLFTLSKNLTLPVANGSPSAFIHPQVANNSFLHDIIWKFPPITILPTCQSAINTKAAALAGNLGTAQSGFIPDSEMGTIHRDYQWGSVYCRTPAEGAHAVYGQIWLKYKATPNYGYPLTDELGTTDNSGTIVRYNVFSQGNAIYWTGLNGAFLIYGDIYQRWLSIGDTKSVVGFPVTDESPSGTHGGRYNDFSNGMIYWHQGNSYVHQGPIPDTLSFTWDKPISLGDVTGSNTITFSSNGNARWQSHMHDSEPWPYDWAVAWVFTNADGTTISLSQHGGVGPNLGWFGTNDNDVDTTVNNVEIGANWRAWVAMYYWKSQADSSFAIVQLITDLYNDIKAIYPYIAAVVSVLA